MWYLQDVKESKRIWDLLLTIMEHFQPAFIVIQHVWSVLIIFTEYLCQDWNKGFYLHQGTFLSFVPPAERERFVRWVCEWVILFSGVKGSKDGQGMTLLSLWFDCWSVNSYSPPRMQPYALYAGPWIWIRASSWQTSSVGNFDLAHTKQRFLAEYSPQFSVWRSGSYTATSRSKVW